MTSGRDRGGGQGAFREGPPARGSGSPFSGPNLPFTVITLVSLVTLVWFLVLVRPFAESGVAAPGTTTTAPTANGEPVTTDPDEPTTTTIPADLPPLQGIRLQRITGDVSFPVYAASIPGDDRVFVLERAGVVRSVSPDGTVSTFLDLTDRVDSAGIENGLLGMAFHPDYADNGRIFIYYTTAPRDSPDSRLSEFRSSGAAATSVDRGTEQILFHVEQRGIRHRAGMVTFGPDGYLYVALGDGGMGDRSSQELNSLQGNILRIDVDRTGPDTPYAIPPGNPFVAGEGRPEIWAYGLRNPWRFSIDPVENLIYIADVGQADREEVNVQPLDAAGLNYGWPNFEGTRCYLPSDGCDMDTGVIPVLEYGHDAPGCSITGGFVYRGSAIPELVGHYFYADWCFGWIRSFRYQDGQVTDERDWGADIAASLDAYDDVNNILVSSFGLDGDGELLVVDSDGNVFRIVPVR